MSRVGSPPKPDEVSPGEIGLDAVPRRRVSPRAWAAIGCTLLTLLALALLAALAWLAWRGIDRLQGV